MNLIILFLLAQIWPRKELPHIHKINFCKCDYSAVLSPLTLSADSTGLTHWFVMLQLLNANSTGGTWEMIWCTLNWAFVSVALHTHAPTMYVCALCGAHTQCTHNAMWCAHTMLRGAHRQCTHNAMWCAHTMLCGARTHVHTQCYVLQAHQTGTMTHYTHQRCTSAMRALPHDGPHRAQLDPRGVLTGGGARAQCFITLHV